MLKYKISNDFLFSFISFTKIKYDERWAARLVERKSKVRPRPDNLSSPWEEPKVHHCLSSLKKPALRVYDTTRLEGNIKRWKETFMIFYLHGSQIISKKSDEDEFHWPTALLKEVLKAKLYFWELLNVQCNACNALSLFIKFRKCFRFQKQGKGIVLYGHGLISSLTLMIK